MVSGLASSIRAADESATFDLAGHDAVSIRSIALDAFSSPFPLDDTIRLTFVVGGGKLSRAKYDDKAMVALTSALRQLEYVEDRGASCVNECAGCWKTQHDTGKNQFTVVVFPKLADGVGKGGANQSGGSDDVEPLIPINSPGYKMAVCSQQTFKNLLSTYCPTYMEKREAVRCLEGLRQVEQAIEEKMMTGHPLDAGEQAFYDEASELKEKHAYAQGEASKHVEEGRLTLEEKRVLVEMNEMRIQTLMEGDDSAAVAKQLKKAMARKQQLQSLTDEKLSALSGSYPPPLRHEAKINALRKKLRPLEDLEAQSRGALLTLSETRSLAEKEDIEREIARLEEASCGWFEDEDAFRDRLHKSRSKFSASKRGGGEAGARTVGKGASSAGKGGGAGSAKWILPGEKPKHAWGSSAAGKKKGKAKGGAVFTAMMMDSSSDEEESDEDDDEEETLEVTSYASTQKKGHPAASNRLTPKKAVQPTKKKSGSTTTAPGKPDNTEKAVANASQPQQTKAKKGKKKKKKSKKASQEEEVPEVDPTAAKSDETLATKESPSSVTDSLRVFWRSLLLPLLTFLASLLVSLVTSMFAAATGSKKGGKKKKRG